MHEPRSPSKCRAEGGREGGREGGEGKGERGHERSSGCLAFVGYKSPWRCRNRYPERYPGPRPVMLKPLPLVNLYC